MEYQIIIKDSGVTTTFFTKESLARYVQSLVEQDIGFEFKVIK